jgi:hypothetical protein
VVELVAQVGAAPGLERLHQAGETVAVLVGVHEVALDAQRLGFAVGLQALAGAAVEQLGVGLEHLLGVAPGLVSEVATSRATMASRHRPASRVIFHWMESGAATWAFLLDQNRTPAVRRASGVVHSAM